MVQLGRYVSVTRLLSIKPSILRIPSDNPRENQFRSSSEKGVKGVFFVAMWFGFVWIRYWILHSVFLTFILVIDTNEMPGFFLLLKNHIFIARSEDTVFIFHVWG